MVEYIDTSATSFRNYEEAKLMIIIDLKTTTTLRKKNKLVKKMKGRFGEGGEEEEEEGDDEQEEEKFQPLLALTQCQGEDKEEDVEGSKGEEVKEAPQPANKKRKEK